MMIAFLFESVLNIIMQPLVILGYNLFFGEDEEQISYIKENDYDFYYIHTFQEKTKTQCFTPLFKIAFQIIKENNNHFPNFNELIVLLL